MRPYIINTTRRFKPVSYIPRRAKQVVKTAEEPLNLLFTTHGYLNDNCEPICLETVGFLASHNPIGLHGLLEGKLYFFMKCI
jgi:hypothetical protein